MRNSFLILIILIALFGGCHKKYDAVAGADKAFITWYNDTITWEGDKRYTITLYAPTKEVNGPRWYPQVYTDVTKYNENTGTLVFQTTREVVRFKGVYVIGKEK